MQKVKKAVRFKLESIPLCGDPAPRSPSMPRRTNRGAFEVPVEPVHSQKPASVIQSSCQPQRRPKTGYPPSVPNTPITNSVDCRLHKWVVKSISAVKDGIHQENGKMPIC